MTSRELDRKVAEALGWRRSELFPTALIYVRGKDECQNLPSYSTDIAAAIGALEGFCKDGQPFGIFRFSGGRKFSVEFRYEPLKWIRSEGNTIPIAICNAILSATSPKQSAGDAAKDTQ